MNNWKLYLNENTLDWLLEDENPSVKYFTLKDILEKPLDNQELVDIKKQIMSVGIASKILETQKPEGYWGKREDFYVSSKYKGTVWNLIILASVGADLNDPRIKKTCEFILNNSQDPKRGGFANCSTKKGTGEPGKVIPCLTGNMVCSLIRFGYLEDPRVQKAIDWITKYQRFDDGDAKYPDDWPYKAHKACFSKHSCHMGAVKSLKALSQIPKNKRNKDVKNTIDKAVKYLLAHHIFKRSHDLLKISKPGWLRLGFPHMYQDDILEILNILTDLEVHDKRMQDAVNIVESKQDNQGRWILENTFNGRYITNIDVKGKPSKWVTLHAIRMLKKYYI